MNNTVVTFASDAALGNAANALFLNGGCASRLSFQTPSMLTNSAAVTSATVDRTVTLGEAGGGVGSGLANGTLTLSGPIGGTGSLFRTGQGVVNLTNTGNNFAGSLVLGTGGVTGVAGDGAMGSNATVILQGGATLQPLSSFTSAKNYLIVGTGNTIYTPAGVNLTIAGDLTTQTSAPSLFHTGDGTLTLTTANTFQGVLNVGDATPAVRLSTNAGSTNNGTVVLGGANGALAVAGVATPAVTINAGGTLTLDNSGGINNNRLGSVAVGLTGSLNLVGNAGGDTSEFVGVSAALGINTQALMGRVTLTQPASGGGNRVTTLVSTSLSPVAGTATLLRGTNLGAASGDRTQILINTPPTTGAGAVFRSGMLQTGFLAQTPTGTATDFVATQATGVNAQVRLVPFAAYAGAIPASGGAAGSVFDQTGATTLTGGVTMAAARFGTGASLDLGSNTLTSSDTTNSSATLLFTGTGAITSTGGTGTIAAGGNAMTVYNAGAVSIGSSTAPVGIVSTANGLNKTGPGTLTLFGTGSTTVGTSGGVRVSEGTLALGNDAALGRATVTTGTNVFPTVTVAPGATLDVSAVTAPARIASVGGFGTLDLGNTTVQTGSSTATLAGLTGTAASKFMLGIPQTQVANNTFANGFTTTLTGNNTGFAGNISVPDGSLIVASNNALGIGTTPVVLGDTGGTNRAQLLLGTNLTVFTRDITVQAGAAPTAPHTLLTQTAGTNLVVGSNIPLGQTLRLSVNTITVGNGETAFSGTISGPGPLEHISGNVAFSGANTYAGGFTMNAGANAVVGLGSDSVGTTSGPLGTGPFTVAAGGVLRADGGARTLSNAVTFSATTVNFGFTGQNNLTLAVADNASSLTSTWNLQSTSQGATTLGGVITASVGIDKNGPGTVVFAAPTGNALTGAVTVNAGTLLVTNTSGSGTGSGAVAVNNGGVFGGTGVVSGTVKVNSGGVLKPGVGTAGTLTLATASSGLTFTAGSVLGVTVTSAATPGAAGSGASTVGTLPNPTSNTFLNQTAGATPVGLGLVTVSADLGNTTFVIDQSYSYAVAGGMGDQGTLSVTAANRFDFFNYNTALYAIAAPSLTGDLAGKVYLNFGVIAAPVPEPATVLGIAAAGYVLMRRCRRRA